MNPKCLGRAIPDTSSARSAHLTGLKMIRISRAFSFNHLVGQQQERLGDGQPHRFRGLEVDHQLELRRPLDRQIAGAGALEDFVHETGNPPPDVRQARRIGDQAVCHRELSETVDRWQPRPRGYRRDLRAVGVKQRARTDVQSLQPFANSSGKGRLELLRRPHVEDADRQAQNTSGRRQRFEWLCIGCVVGIDHHADARDARYCVLEQTSCLPISASSPSFQKPVTLPPGRARLAASPTSVASWLVAMTIGIVRVALWVPTTAAGHPTAITAGLRATSSLASAGSVATWPSAKLKAKATLP